MDVLLDLLDRLYLGEGDGLMNSLGLVTGVDSGLLRQVFDSEVFDREIQTESVAQTRGAQDKLRRNDNRDWYKQMQMYVTYANSFVGERTANFYTLAEKLKYIKDLGCNAIHVLPFFSSPMVDGGFDVSDYYQVREELGGNQAFDYFLERAQGLGLRVFADLVLNHVSDQHEWFKKAVSGDGKYQNYFIWQKQPPELVEIFENNGEKWARYVKKLKIKNEKLKISSLVTRSEPVLFGIDTYVKRIIFPERAGEIPHWRLAADGCWYYHTFYPEQLDLNWDNPGVFVEFVKILRFWADKGVHFRLDAVPYLADKGTEAERPERVHLILQALHQVVPERRFLIESTQSVGKMTKYFGPGEIIEAELVYNFNLMNKLWLSLLERKAGYVWEAFEEARGKPVWGQWVNFLRNHDDLMIESSDPQVQERIYSYLVSKGKRFKVKAIAGRMASFLDRDERRIVMAFMLLASLPGVPEIYYGDELGKDNETKKLKNKKAKKIEDSRVINRGQVGAEELKSIRAKELHKHIKMIFNRRLEYIDTIADGNPERLVVPEGVFGCRYKFSEKRIVKSEKPQLKSQKLNFKNSEFSLPAQAGIQNPGELETRNSKPETKLLVYVNLRATEVRLPVKEGGGVVLEVNGGKFETGEIILPAYAGVWMTL